MDSVTFYFILLKKKVMSVRNLSLLIGIRHRVCLCMSKSSLGSVGVENINICILCVYLPVFACGGLVWLLIPSPVGYMGTRAINLSTRKRETKS